MVQAQRGSSQPQFNVLVVRPFPLLWLLGMLAVHILCDLFRGMLGVRIWWDCAVFDRRLGPDLARVAHLDRIVSVWESSAQKFRGHDDQPWMVQAIVGLEREESQRVDLAKFRFV